jgi:tricorn protease
MVRNVRRALGATTLALAVAAAAAAPSRAQDPPLWMRYPAISPDGSTIVFGYKGDLYAVPSAGGTARALTLGETYEFAPVWSHDGSSIAFASDRYGNFDVFVMPSVGGEARRLTFHSAPEVPSSFTATDDAVLFSGYRQQLATDVQFPIPLMTHLYSVPVQGGRVGMVLPVPALNATVDASGSKVIYEDVKGYEDTWRKHHTSSVTRDVWVHDAADGSYRQLSDFEGENRNPVFDADDDGFFYLTERSGSFNVWRSSLSAPATSTQLTRFADNPVRFLTRARNGTLCFGFRGEIYTMTPGGEPAKVSIRIAQDGRTAIDETVPVNQGFTEATLSPNGKEFAYVFRGEIFVSAVEGGMTKRVTDTSWQERSVRFSPDGRSLVYAAERDGSWNVYTTTIAREEEPFFHAATLLEETTVVATDAEEYQPAFSPDGKEVAYLEDRVVLRVVNLESGQRRTILTAEHNYSYADGDQYYAWSPDGRWFLVQYGYLNRIFTPQVGLVAADGSGALHDLTKSGYDDFGPKWVMGGKAMIWASDREGTRAQGGNLTSGDVYAMFFSHAAWDRFRLTKEELAVVKEAEKADSASAADSTQAEVTIDWEGLDLRRARLTVNTSPVSDWVLSNDGEKLFYLTVFDKGNDVWVTETRTRDTKLLAKMGANSVSAEMSPDGSWIFVLADGKPVKVATSDGQVTPLRTTGEMVVRKADERAYIFDHAWRQFREKFYLPEITHVDWPGYRTEYARFLPHIDNNYDFAWMLGEMLGEVNVSHTGGRFRPTRPNTDATAELGLLFDYGWTGDGLRVAEVIEGGPADKSGSRIRAGTIVTAIDGTAVTPDIDFYALLNRKVGDPTLLSLRDPGSGSTWVETVKPVDLGANNELMYQRWVRRRRAEVDSLSNGRLGYIHVRSMNDASMRTAFDEAMGMGWGKEGLVVDTRFNGGGNIHEQLSDFLSGKAYFDVIPHGQQVGQEPFDKWTSPSIVIINESDYSDAHLFPLAYREKGIGQTVGMPVPGTGTFVWWETQIDPTLVFGIPMGGWRTPDGLFGEGNQFEPDVRQPMDPAVMTGGHDQQIEAAVRALLGGSGSGGRGR